MFTRNGLPKIRGISTLNMIASYDNSCQQLQEGEPVGQNLGQVFEFTKKWFTKLDSHVNQLRFLSRENKYLNKLYDTVRQLPRRELLIKKILTKQEIENLHKLRWT